MRSTSCTLCSLDCGCKLIVAQLTNFTVLMVRHLFLIANAKFGQYYINMLLIMDTFCLDLNPCFMYAVSYCFSWSMQNKYHYSDDC